MLDDDYQFEVDPPWHFVGHETSPCPFIVAVDYGVMAAPTLGQGGRAYSVWFFGYKQIIYDRLHWLS